MPTKTEDASFAVAQAARCLRLAGQCSDIEIARRLRELAQAFNDYADGKGAMPSPMRTQNTGFGLRRSA
ncbi:MAG TPA: hypothetical protein VFQ90_08400 [Stellaceae bacterium]|jgi:hypothetical protein|nr:hypothetical protein [Stellaceae bacterium]